MTDTKKKAAPVTVSKSRAGDPRPSLEEMIDEFQQVSAVLAPLAEREKALRAQIKECLEEGELESITVRTSVGVQYKAYFTPNVTKELQKEELEIFLGNHGKKMEDFYQEKEGNPKFYLRPIL